MASLALHVAALAWLARLAAATRKHIRERPFGPGAVHGAAGSSSLQVAGVELRKPDFETVEIQLPWTAPSAERRRPLASCPVEGAALPEQEADAHLQQALAVFCKAGLERFTAFYVDPRFEGNLKKFRGEDGWIDKAYLTYVGLKRERDEIGGEEDLLLQSVHHFSKMPVVVANFGKRLPKSWTPERFPNMVLLHAQSTADLRKSFNFNKHTSMMFAKIKSGLALDADQFANRGLDYMLQRSAEETTKEYPYPIQPVHWMSRDPEASDMQYYNESFKWVWKVPGSAPKRTMRWGHAHPTWSHHAVPWLAKWTAWVLAPHRFMKEMPEWVRKQGYFEDEDLMNVALWASNATKQWCKFEPGVSHFEMYMSQKGQTQIYPDSKFYPKGIAYVFFTAHDAKRPEESFKWLSKLWDAGDDKRKAILYDGQWFGSAEALRAYDPGLRCII